MLPPVLEIYVVWHSGDVAGAAIHDEFLEHFHGTAYSGLIGGAIEVYARSARWVQADGAPRPIPIPIGVEPLPAGMRGAQFAVVVPVLGNELAAAVQPEGSSWHRYLADVLRARLEGGDRVGIFPLVLHERAINGTKLGQLFAHVQCIAASAPRDGETPKSVRCRDLAQGIAQLLSRPVEQRLTVFISHTKHQSPGERENVEGLVAAIRDAIGGTHLSEFFDSSDLQPGRDWDAELRAKAATSALLAVRTHLYASREWCQREVLIAKREGMPVIVMDALDETEERGSFLMDHVPRVPTRTSQGRWSRIDIHQALGLLVDECLKRELWRWQSELSQGELDFDIAWWAPHAPEPLTLAKWILDQRQAGLLNAEGDDIRVLHPDPPLGADEKLVLQEIMALAGVRRLLDVMTPRILATRSA